jgi:hypothetical protein
MRLMFSLRVFAEIPIRPDQGSAARFVLVITSAFALPLLRRATNSPFGG